MLLQAILLERDQRLDQLKANMTKSQQFMKRNADKNRRNVEFKDGELVLVKLQPYLSTTFYGIAETSEN